MQSRTKSVKTLTRTAPQAAPYSKKTKKTASAKKKSAKKTKFTNLPFKKSSALPRLLPKRKPTPRMKMRFTSLRWATTSDSSITSLLTKNTTTIATKNFTSTKMIAKTNRKASMATRTNPNLPRLLLLELGKTRSSSRARPALRTAARAMNLLLGIQPALAAVDALASSGLSVVAEIADGIADVAATEVVTEAEIAGDAPIAVAADAADSIVAAVPV